MPHKDEAISLIRGTLGRSGDDIEDLGHISEQLLMAMSLAPGAFVRIDGVSRVAQQQPRPELKKE